LLKKPSLVGSLEIGQGVPAAADDGVYVSADEARGADPWVTGGVDGVVGAT
jgi:hypothetical protein